MARPSATTLESECTDEEVDFLLSVLKENRFTDRHLEIGTAAGGTLKQIIGVYDDRDFSPGFVVIDPLSYFENQLQKVHQNLRNSGIDPGRVDFWKGTTQDFIVRERADCGTFDFVFIDGDHRHYPVMVDLQWAELVRPGGCICLHDRNDRFPGVGWAIDRFLERNRNFSQIGQAGSLVALRKEEVGNGRSVTWSDLAAAKVGQRGHKLARSIRKRIG